MATGGPGVIQKLKPQEHEVSCCKCGNIGPLLMLPLRNDVRMIGWVFICEGCIDEFVDRAFTVQLVEV